MKKILFLSLFSLLLLESCGKRGKQRMFIVFQTNGTGFETSQTTIKCDSVNMLSKGHAIIYVDGISTTIYGDEIMVATKKY
jgi:hypothetical protein